MLLNKWQSDVIMHYRQQRIRELEIRALRALQKVYVTAGTPQLMLEMFPHSCKIILNELGPSYRLGGD